MTVQRTAPLLASITALAGFLVALVSGMLAGNLVESIIEHSILALGLCFAGGFLVGRLIEGIIVRHAQELRVDEEAPMPEELAEAGEGVAPTVDSSSELGSAA